MTPPVYTRKLSPEEIKGSLIMIPQGWLKVFPKVGEEFTVKIRGLEFTTTISRVSCRCRGPDDPHYHWYMDAAEFIYLLPKHDYPQITIYRTGEKSYELVIWGSFF